MIQKTTRVPKQRTCILAAESALLLLVGVSACAPRQPPDPATLIHGYFAKLNAAMDPAAQSEFLRSTQHPDFLSRYCANGNLTFTEDPAWTTLHQDTQWAPQGAQRPRGTVYTIAVLLTAKRSGAEFSTQISAAHIVELNGRVYGFSPCGT